MAEGGADASGKRGRESAGRYYQSAFDESGCKPRNLGWSRARGEPFSVGGAGCIRGVNERRGVEDGQIHGDHDAAHDERQANNQDWFEKRGEGRGGVIHLFVVRVGNLHEEVGQGAGLLPDIHHPGNHRRKQRRGFKRGSGPHAERPAEAARGAPGQRLARAADAGLARLDGSVMFVGDSELTGLIQQP